MSNKNQSSYEKVVERRTSKEQKKKKGIIPLVLFGILGLGGIAAGTAVWFTYKPKAVEPFQVKFDANYEGATVEGATEVKLDQTTTFGKINKPKLSNGPEGKMFECWTSDKEGKNPILDKTNVDKETTVYAKWNVGEFKLTFKALSSETTKVTLKGTTDITVSRGKTWADINKPNAIKVSDPTYDYELDYWTTNEAEPSKGKITDSTPIDKDLTIYPIFKNNSKQVSITFTKQTTEKSEAKITFNGYETLTISAATDLPFDKWNKPTASKTIVVEGVTLNYPFDKWLQETSPGVYEEIPTGTCFTENTTIVPQFSTEPTIYDSKYYIINETNGFGEIIDDTESQGDTIKVKYQNGKDGEFPKSTFDQKVYIGSKTTSIVPNFLAGCKSYNQTIEIPEHVTFIGSGFMSGCSQFNNGGSSLDIPKNVLGIGGSFLEECSNFNQKINFGTKIETIGDSFLFNSDSFDKEIDLSQCSNLKTIGSLFLCQADNFNSSITFPNSLTEIGDDFLRGAISFNKPIDLSQTKITKIKNNFLYETDVFASQISLPESQITEFGNNFVAWANPEGITPLIPKIDLSQFTQLTKIGDGFLNNSPHTWDEIVIPATVTSIGINFNRRNYYFKGKITFAENSQITSLGDSFMYSNTNWQGNGFTLPTNKSLTIGNEFLFNCTKFSQILIIPSNVTKVGSSFCYCMDGMLNNNNYIEIDTLSGNYNTCYGDSDGEYSFYRNSGFTSYKYQIYCKNGSFTDFAKCFPNAYTKYKRFESYKPSTEK